MVMESDAVVDPGAVVLATQVLQEEQCLERRGATNLGGGREKKGTMKGTMNHEPEYT